MMETRNSKIAGHFLAVFTMLVWGTTYISTKVLLADFSPLQILAIRFVLGFLILLAAHPKKMDHSDKKLEFLFAVAGISGIGLYYLLENISLLFTTASNVGVIISTAPFFTALVSGIMNPREKPKAVFYAGFVVSMTGICFISFGGGSFSFNIKGDFLALMAAAVWALYSTVTEKIGKCGIPSVQATRHIFFYGILLMVPLCIVFGEFSELGKLASAVMKPVNLGNLLFLSVLASAVCFVSWTKAVNCIGAVVSGLYIYIVPVITVVASFIILKEEITVWKTAGVMLAISGLAISRKDSRA